MAKKAAEIPLHEQVILEPELEEALKNATDAEMCDIAGGCGSEPRGPCGVATGPAVYQHSVTPVVSSRPCDPHSSAAFLPLVLLASHCVPAETAPIPHAQQQQE